MKIKKNAILFCLGGGAYTALELLWRGWSHISMFVTGGLCFLLIGGLEKAKPRLPLPLRMLTGAGIITMLELAAGLLVNRDYTVWDYRGQPGNFLGQICPVFCLLWVPVSLLAITLFELADKWLSPKPAEGQR